MEIKQIKELLKSPKNRVLINKAILLQNRVAFHTEYNDANPYKIIFGNWCKSMIDQSKWSLFDKYFVTPHSNLNFTTKVFEQYQKIFNARNSFRHYSFINNNHSSEFKNYLVDINSYEFWRTTGFKQLESNYNSLIVMTTKEQKPSYFFLDINFVHDLSNSDTLNYVIYKESDTIYVCYDDEKITKWELNENEYTLIEETYHKLGFCPIVWFWNKNLNQNSIVKEHPFTDSLGDLDWLLFSEISKNHSDLYALYPIITNYVDDCNYSDASGSFCQNGYLVRNNDEGNIINNFTNGIPTECPICGTSKLSGAGTSISVATPTAEDSTNILESVKFITSNTDNLRLIEEKIISKQEKLYISLTGASKNIDKAINEKQVLSVNSDKEQVLSNLAYTYSLSEKLANDMLAKYLYNDFLSSDINYGNKFYIYSVEELYSQFKEGIKESLSESLLQDLRLQIIETEDKMNLTEYQRKLMLLAVEPLPYLSVSERKNYVESGLVSRNDVIIQNYFMYFISQFELEYGKLTDFEKEKDFNSRINLIKSVLATYADAKTK